MTLAVLYWEVVGWVKTHAARRFNMRGFTPTLHGFLTLSRNCEHMPRYRRLYVPGGTYFFTVTLADRSATTLTDEIRLLRSVYASVTAQHPLRCDAMVVLPDHIHAVWTLPPGDDDFSTRWKKIKSLFSRHSTTTGYANRSRRRNGESGIWQRRFWEHAIRDDADFIAHVHYCHFNPVKHGLTDRPEDWLYSTIHRNIRTAA